MGTKVGLWVDHRKAIIVAVTDEVEETRLIISKVEKQLRRTGGSPLKGPYEPHQVPTDISRKRAFMGHLDIYYNAIIASIRESEAILILGPGEAKSELKECLDRHNLGGLVVGIEAADKMTDHQVAVRVRKQFAT